MVQQGILSLSIKDRQTLYSAYMPFIKGGGLFVQSTKRYALEDEVFLLLTILELEERLPIPGKVIWITPPGAQGNRRPGIGVQFADTSDGVHARTIIETHLAQLLSGEKRTHTM